MKLKFHKDGIELRRTRGKTCFWFSISVDDDVPEPAGCWFYRKIVPDSRCFSGSTGCKNYYPTDNPYIGW